MSSFAVKTKPLSSLDCHVDMDETEFSESSNYEEDFTPITMCHGTATLHSPACESITEETHEDNDGGDGELEYAMDAPIKVLSSSQTLSYRRNSRSSSNNNYNNNNNKVATTFALLAAGFMLFLATSYALGNPFGLGHVVVVVEPSSSSLLQNQLVQDQEQQLMMQLARVRHGGGGGGASTAHNDNKDTEQHIMELQNKLVATTAALRDEETRLAAAQAQNEQAKQDAHAMATEINDHVWQVEQDLQRLHQTLLQEEGPKAAAKVKKLQQAVTKSVSSLYGEKTPKQS